MFFGAATEEEATESVQMKKEVEAYFSETPAPSSTDPLQWWRLNECRFPHIAEIAKAVLCTPATSVPSERVFSAVGHIVSKRRAGFSEENVEALIFLQQNRGMRSAQYVTPAPVAMDMVVADELPALPSL
eukprot:scpid87563/ scgid28199/ 